MDKEKAISQYNKYKEKDPFPDIKPALLNSADIISYGNTTGMLSPFNEDAVKTASYTACINGTCWYWEDDGTKRVVDLKKEGKFTLKSNSIAYVEIEPEIRLPIYMAIRFNLKITHVYRGLLLGTGPLVDPGFEGKIFIPLHNLTSNEYTFNTGEELIWIEFTKISTLPNAPELEPIEIKLVNDTRCRDIKEFPPKKKNQGIDSYIKKALQNHSYTKIVSSIPMAVSEAKNEASSAKASVDETKKHVRFLSLASIFGGFGVLVGFSSLIYSSWNLQREHIETIKIEMSNSLEKQNNSIHELKARVENFITTVTNQNKKISNQKEIIHELKNKINELENTNINKNIQNHKAIPINEEVNNGQQD